MRSIDNAGVASLLVSAAESVWSGCRETVTIRIAVSDRLRDSMEAQGIWPLESAFITDSDIRHIMKRHASHEAQRGQVEVVPAHFALLPEVLNDFDTCEHTDTDKLGNKRFLLTKRIGDTFYVATVQRGKRKLEIKTMWILPGASC